MRVSNIRHDEIQSIQGASLAPSLSETYVMNDIQNMQGTCAALCFVSSMGHELD